MESLFGIHRPRRWGLQGLLVLVAAVVMIASATVPAHASGTYSTLNGANIRSGPGTGYSIVGGVSKGARVTIDCYLDGERISGTTIWDHLVGGGYITDALLLTGSDNPVVPKCGSNQPAKTYPTLAAVNVRTGSNTSASVITTLPKGAQVTIDCYVDGQNVSGTTIWDHRVDGGYLTDSLLLTGSNGPVVPKCASTPPPPPPPPAPKYNRQAALNFTEAHWNDRARIWWAPDCTYFASSILWAGGLPKDSDWTDNSSDKSKLASSHMNPGPTKDAAAADYLKNYLVDKHYGTIRELSWNDANIPDAQIGDLILYDWEDKSGNNGPDGLIDHISIVDKLTSEGPLVAMHTDNHHLQGWKWSSKKNTWIWKGYPGARVYLIHITY